MQENQSSSIIPHYSTWMNTVILNNIYSFLSFRKGLNFRLVNSAFNEELGISSFRLQRRDNILNRIEWIRKEKHRSLQFLHGGILKINAEIRNCIMMGAKRSDESILDITEEYSSLYRDGTVSFSSWIAESGPRNQGGRSELKFSMKSGGVVIFTQHYIYGNEYEIYSTNGNSLLYLLKMRFGGEDLEAETLIRLDFVGLRKNCYMSNSKIEQVLEMLNVPPLWNVRDLIRFLVISSSAYPITFDNTIDLIEDIIKFGNSDEIRIAMEGVNAEQREGEKYIEQIIEPLIVSNRKLNDRRKQLEILRKTLVKIYSEKSENRYNIEKKKKSITTIAVDQKMLKNLLSKLINFTHRERVLFECKNYYSKSTSLEKYFVEAKFKTNNKSIIVVALNYEHLRMYNNINKSTLTLTIDNKKVNMENVYSRIMGGNGNVEKNELRKFGIALLTLFGQFFTVKFSRDSENTRAIYDCKNMEEHLRALTF